MSTPSFRRWRALSRSLDNDDLLLNIRKPVLIVPGDRDRVVKPAAADQHRALLGHARVEMMPGAGHAPFWDAAGAFNGHLRDFCERLEVTSVA